ncbi:MAG: hypothetical protein BroJett029_27410 [Alphaproteobacteria bacterium]|nr:MAG: hypothetical protein BroJett029_27410 [Alphaproteobacteria bacterium]
MAQNGTGRQVIAIGLDSAEFDVVNRWIEAGHLPNIARVFRSGAVSELQATKGYTAETPWTMCLTGCKPGTSGFWTSIRYTPDYRIEDTGAYDYADCGVFYGYCRGRKVIALDVPHARPAAGIDGLQLLAWGAHSPLGSPASVPEELFDEVVAKYGEHPAFNHDDMLVWETETKRQALQDALITGIRRRTQMCVDLMQTHPWNLLLIVFGEPHSAGHHFWHLSQPEHPLYETYATSAQDPMLSVYEAADEAVGRILAHAPQDAYVMLFSPEGMKANSSDLPSWFFLPELLFRASFEGRAGMANGRAGAPLPPIGRHERMEWMRAMWALREDANPLRRFVRSRLRLRASWQIERLLGSGFGPDHPLSTPSLRYMPPVWYRNAWPAMKAFALPTFSDGYVRINLRGREARGIVDPADYDRVCGELSDLLHGLTDARTGQPMVAEIVRCRKSAGEPSVEHSPDADLLVLWTETPTDTVDHPVYGRIGPVPFRRTGDHRPRGFFAATGPDIPAGRLPAGELVDIAPTILDLLEVPIPNHFEGRARLGPNGRLAPNGG